MHRPLARTRDARQALWPVPRHTNVQRCWQPVQAPPGTIRIGDDAFIGFKR
jgi:hypothetical protein